MCLAEFFFKQQLQDIEPPGLWARCRIMFKGIAALFTSGIIFNPMVLLGIVLGIYCAFSLKSDAIAAVYHNYNLYLMALVVSTAYVVVFKKVYKDDGMTLDVPRMALRVIGGVVKFVFASFLTISFVYMFSL